MAFVGMLPMQPAERLDADFDFAPFLSDDDELVSATVAVAPTGELTASAVLVGDRVKVWMDSGVNGKTYKVTVTVTTQAGRIKQDELRVRVKEI